MKVSDEDWPELKRVLLDITKAHDVATAYTQENMGLHMLVEMMVTVYEHGRSRTLPVEWRQAHEVMRGRRDPRYKEHVRKREEVRAEREQFAHLEELDMTELTGGPMHTFLRKKSKKK